MIRYTCNATKTEHMLQEHAVEYVMVRVMHVSKSNYFPPENINANYR